jgi:hypothetical protein
MYERINKSQIYPEVYIILYKYHFPTINFTYSSKVYAVDLITSSPAVTLCTVPCNIKRIHILPHSTLVRFLILSVWMSIISLNSLNRLALLTNTYSDLCEVRTKFLHNPWFRLFTVEARFLIGTVHVRFVIKEVMGFSLSTLIFPSVTSQQSSALICIQLQLLTEKTKSQVLGNWKQSTALPEIGLFSTEN